MLKYLIRYLRFASKAERILLGYKALGLSEEQALARWKADLQRAAVGDPPALSVRADGTTEFSGTVSFPKESWDWNAIGTSPAGFTYPFRKHDS